MPHQLHLPNNRNIEEQQCEIVALCSSNGSSVLEAEYLVIYFFLGLPDTICGCVPLESLGKWR